MKIPWVSEGRSVSVSDFLLPPFLWEYPVDAEVEAKEEEEKEVSPTEKVEEKERRVSGVS